jgi:hypothetical protein
MEKTGWKKPEKKTATPDCHDTRKPRSLGWGRMNRDARNRRREIRLTTKCKSVNKFVANRIKKRLTIVEPEMTTKKKCSIYESFEAVVFV